MCVGRRDIDAPAFKFSYVGYGNIGWILHIPLGCYIMPLLYITPVNGDITVIDSLMYKIWNGCGQSIYNHWICNMTQIYSTDFFSTIQQVLVTGYILQNSRNVYEQYNDVHIVTSIQTLIDSLWCYMLSTISIFVLPSYHSLSYSKFSIRFDYSIPSRYDCSDYSSATLFFSHGLIKSQIIRLLIPKHDFRWRIRCVLLPPLRACM